jgi:hypothetical protein
VSLTKLSLDGNYDVIYKLFLHRESLVNDIPAGDGNIEKLFLQCRENLWEVWRVYLPNFSCKSVNKRMERGVAGFLLNVYLSSPEIVFLNF